MDEIIQDKWLDANKLIKALQNRGIAYLVGDKTTIAAIEDIGNDGSEQLSDTELIQQLVQCQYPRVRDASISLFLLHPELSTSVENVLRQSDEQTKQQLTTLVLATLYLQHLWSIQLALTFGHSVHFPEEPFTALWQNNHLPSPTYQDGDYGLTLLERAEQKRTGLPLSYRGDWQNQIDQLLLQEKKSYGQITPQISFYTIEDENSRSEEAEDFYMSMRPDVDKQRIEQFLKDLGRTYRKPGRVYLVGGAALVHAGLRPGATQDIDIEIRAANEDEMSEAIRRLKDTTKVNVEFATPADFIPLPSQWESNARYIGRYGSIDAFYFDFYSIALSKIERGNNRDINDVRLLLQYGYIDLTGLDAAYQEILPKVGKRPYTRIDPQRFAAQYQAIRQLLEQ